MHYEIGLGLERMDDLLFSFRMGKNQVFGRFDIINLYFLEMSKYSRVYESAFSAGIEKRVDVVPEVQLVYGLDMGFEVSDRFSEYPEDMPISSTMPTGSNIITYTNTFTRSVFTNLVAGILFFPAEKLKVRLDYIPRFYWSRYEKESGVLYPLDNNETERIKVSHVEKKYSQSSLPNYSVSIFYQIR